MDVLMLIGRALFALLFLASVAAHLTKTEAMAGYAASRGVPAARPATIASGLMNLAGGVSIALGIWADLGALLIAIFAFPTVVLMHGFWREKEAPARQTEQTHFLKDTAPGGAALMLLAFFSFVGDDLGLTITGPLLDIS